MADTVQHHHAITEKGLTLLLKQQASMREGMEVLEIPLTRVVAGEGYTTPVDLEKLEELSSPVGEMEIGPYKLIDGKVLKLPLRLSNENLTDTAIIRQIGVYCLDPEEGEILYQVVQFDTAYQVLSLEATGGAISAFSPEIDLTFANGKAVAIDTSPGWALTPEDLVAHNRDPKAHEGRFEQIGDRLEAMDESFTAWQNAQDVRLQLLEDTLITDIQDNKKIIVFGDISGIHLIQGVYNHALARLEC